MSLIMPPSVGKFDIVVARKNTSLIDFYRINSKRIDPVTPAVSTSMEQP